MENFIWVVYLLTKLSNGMVWFRLLVFWYGLSTTCKPNTKFQPIRLWD